MSIYDFLSRFRWLGRYSAKFLFVAFLGIHIPLLGIISFLVSSKQESFDPLLIFLITLAFTLLATGITLYILNQLLAPLTLTKTALEAYLGEKKAPDLPTQYTDEVGVLMRKVQFTVTTLDDLIRAKREMIGVLSRDMRTPLGQLIMTAELIETQKADPAAVTHARWIIESGRKQLNSLEHVLQLLQQGDLEVHPEDLKPVDLNDLLRETLPALDSLLTENHLSLEIDLPENFTVRVKKDLFREALQHLLQNALEFSHPHGKVTVTAHLAKGRSVVKISDSGVGFQPLHADRLFDLFTTKPNREAGKRRSGMGLYLSRKIVERHQGKLEAKSEGSTQGVTFTITLPSPGP